jgi:hypothetical protein
VFDAKLKAGDIQFRLRGRAVRAAQLGKRQQLRGRLRVGRQMAAADRHDNEVGRTLFEKLWDRDLTASNATWRSMPMAAMRSAGGGGCAAARLGPSGLASAHVYPDCLVFAARRRSRTLLALANQKRSTTRYAVKRDLCDLLEAAYTTGRDVGEMELTSDAPLEMRFRHLDAAELGSLMENGDG